MEQSISQYIDIANPQLAESLRLGFWQGFKILSLSLIAGTILRKIYMKYSLTFSSPRNFGNTILVVLLCVSSLIAVVKSSLALSLGLVGALSVIRFRTAVKEPYTLSFILLSVCIGISIGAEQYLFAFLSLSFGTAITLVINRFESRYYKSKGLFSTSSEILTITASTRKAVITAINIAKSHSDSLTIKSFNINKDNSSGTIQITLEDLEKLDELTKEISQVENVLNISFYNSPS